MMAGLTAAQKRDKSRRAGRAFAKRLRESGWYHGELWIKQSVHAIAVARAAPINARVGSVYRAALEHGLRTLPASAIIRAESEWSGSVGLPVATRWPGRPFKHPVIVHEPNGKLRALPRNAERI